MNKAQISKDKPNDLLTFEQVLGLYFVKNKALLMAINLNDYTPRILTGVDDKRYVVLYSNPLEIHSDDTRTSCLAMPSLKLFQELLLLKDIYNLDGMIINPWGKRVTITWQLVRNAYYQYQVYQYAGDTWWNSISHVDDYEALMWNNQEPYDEIWLEELIERQNRKIINVAWWAQEQPQEYRPLPKFIQIWLAFYGLFWLQTIFAAGLNTLYNKEMDEASVIQSVILSIGIYFIFRYRKDFTDWWYAREEKKQAILEQEAWEAAAPEREAQAKLEEEISKKATELLEKKFAEEQDALKALTIEE